MRRDMLSIAAVLLLGVGCDDPHPTKLPEITVLARVDTVDITDADFVEAVAKLDVSGADHNLEQWRRRLQIIIDRQLLFLEARKRGFYDDPRVINRVLGWERTRLIDELTALELARLPPGAEDAGRQLFEELGGQREIGVALLSYADHLSAKAALAAVRRGSSFETIIDRHPPTAATGDSLGAMRWHSALTVREPQMLAVVRSGVGAAELIEGRDRHTIIMAVAERTVTYEERRERADRMTVQRRREQARQALMHRLVNQYEVELNTEALSSLRGGTDVDPSVPLVRSSFGDWTVGDYRAATGPVLGTDAAVPYQESGRSALEAQVLRTFVSSQLIDREARALGVAGPTRAEHQLEINRAAIEALWDKQALDEIDVTDADVRRYITENRARFAAALMAPAQTELVWARAEREFKEELAKPQFELYIAELRRRYEAVVSIDDESFFALVSRLRRQKAPIQM